MPYSLNSTLGTIHLKGEKTQTFLQGQLTCDMDKINQHSDYSLAACCDHKGRMVANFWVMRWHDDYLFLLPHAMTDIVIEHLKKYAVFSKVTLAPCELPLDISIQEKPDGCAIQLPNQKRYLTITAQNTASKAAIQDNTTTWLYDNIQAGLALLTPETSLQFTPQMINLEKLGGVSFEKGCYVGQEIVARTQHLGKLKRHLHRIEMTTGKMPADGETLLNKNNEPIGVVVNAVQTNAGRVIALAVLHDAKITDSSTFMLL